MPGLCGTGERKPKASICLFDAFSASPLPSTLQPQPLSRGQLHQEQAVVWVLFWSGKATGSAEPHAVLGEEQNILLGHLTSWAGPCASTQLSVYLALTINRRHFSSSAPVPAPRDVAHRQQNPARKTPHISTVLPSLEEPREASGQKVTSDSPYFLSFLAVCPADPSPALAGWQCGEYPAYRDQFSSLSAADVLDPWGLQLRFLSFSVHKGLHINV